MNSYCSGTFAQTDALVSFGIDTVRDLFDAVAKDVNGYAKGVMPRQDGGMTVYKRHLISFLNHHCLAEGCLWT